MKTLAFKKVVESKYQIQAQSDCLKCKGYGCRCGGRCKQCIDHEAGLHKEIYVDRMKGGLADDKKPSDFDKEDLKEGIKVEREHAKDPQIAREIAMDHLTEDKKYYKKLKKIEKNEN